MNLEKMLQMQKNLDERIIKAKGLEGQDLFPNTVLALQVELAEFANEWRGFKFWSKDQEPRTQVPVTGWGEPFKNPLLEEYVDGVHFFLSIANQKGWQDALYIYEEAIGETREEGLDGGLTGIFLEMSYFLNKCYFENPSKEKSDEWEEKFGFPQKQYWFRIAWSLFITIGLVGFDLTPEKIEEAYMQKNAVNHQRQENGY